MKKLTTFAAERIVIGTLINDNESNAPEVLRGIARGVLMGLHQGDRITEEQYNELKNKDFVSQFVSEGGRVGEIKIKNKKVKTVEVPKGRKAVLFTKKQLDCVHNIMATIDDESHQDFKDSLWTSSRMLNSICDALWDADKR